MDWSKKIFDKATSQSSLKKLIDEIVELNNALEHETRSKVLEEYVDCLMCLLHSASAKGFTIDEISKAFYRKLKINMSSKWSYNSKDNTYSRVKE